MAKKQVTIHDIANFLGISASTVSRALADHPRISHNTKEAVQKAARKLNYKPNKLASNLRKGTGNTIGVIIPIINRHFFANIIHGIERIASSKDYSVIICQSDEKLNKEIESLQTLVKNRVDGILISVSSESRSGNHFSLLKDSDIPLVMFDRVLEESAFSKVVNDDFSGAYKATKHLIGQGYREIIHFGGPQHIASYKKRHEGYRRALLDQGLQYSSGRFFENVISREKGAAITAGLIRDGITFDALFAASDMSALGALLELKKNKLPVPDKIGIVGYVNEPFTEFIEPSLTSMEQFGEAMGMKAAELLFRKIEETDNQVSITKIEPELIVRESSVRGTEGKPKNI